MRYRPFARAGIAVSALSVALDGEADARSADGWRDLIHAAFEAGVNAFEIVRPTDDLLDGVAEGAAAVPRHLLFMALRVPAADDPSALAGGVDELIGRSRLKSLDLVSLDAAQGAASGAPAAMRVLTDTGRAARLGVAGGHDAAEPQVQAGDFEALITPFNLLSGWRERHMVRTAMERQSAVIGLDYFPPRAAEMAKTDDAPVKTGWFAKPASPLAGAGSYAFLRQTPGWTPEQLCLAYALTEPALATVQVRPKDADHLAALAEVVERDLPAAAAAQIEMARFSAERASGTERRKTLRSA